jgi:hypothetical protein
MYFFMYFRNLFEFLELQRKQKTKIHGAQCWVGFGPRPGTVGPVQPGK